MAPWIIYKMIFDGDSLCYYNFCIGRTSEEANSHLEKISRGEYMIITSDGEENDTEF